MLFFLFQNKDVKINEVQKILYKFSSESLKFYLVLTHFNTDELIKYRTVFGIGIERDRERWKTDVESERRPAHSCQCPGAIRLKNTDSH